MDIRKLQRAIVDGLEDVKAQDIAVFNTEHLSPLFERVVIATANSARQTKALASSVREAVRKAGFPAPRSEGEENGEWIIVDCGAAVAHVMQPGIRDYYHLEEIWGDKPVRMKLGGDAPLVAAAHASAPAGRKAQARKTAEGKSVPGAARKAPAAKAPAGKAAATAKTTAGAGKKPAARKTAAGTAAAGRTRTAARKTPANGQEAAAKPVRKPAARKTAAKTRAGAAE